MMQNLVARLGLVLLVLFAFACGEDSVKSGGSGTDCPEGETYNPILSQCEPVNFNNSGGNVAPGNVDPGNALPNNSSNGSTNVTTNNSANLDAGTEEDDSGFNTPDLPCGVGSLIGRACAPSGDILAAADVTVSGTDCDGNPFEVTTRTTGDGTFEFDEVPSGTHTLEVSTGSFNTSRSIFVRAGVVNDYTDASEKVCVDANVSLAVIEGEYDAVEDVLDSLNLSYDVKGGDTFSNTQQAVDFLSNANAMSQYDVVLINCGDLYNNIQLGIYGNVMPQIVSALQTFVGQGGSLYVSDWASPFFESAFPDLIDFYGDDTALEEARWGYAPQIIDASVVSPDLQTTLNANTASIDFPHNPPAVYNDHWVVPTAAGAGVTVHLEGAAQLCQNQLCSMGGAMQADAPLLTSYKDPSGGTVIFTSFHNHSDSSAPISPEMEKILRFLILQL